MVTIKVMVLLYEQNIMSYLRASFLAALGSSLMMSTTLAADLYSDTLELFKNAGQSAVLFDQSYGYAIFPNVAKGALGIGGAHGAGRMYEQGRYVGDITLDQVSSGFQAGGQAFSQIVFLQDKRSFSEFTSGQFGFSAGVGAVAITASASALATSQGSSAGASGGRKDAATVGEFYKGMAVFTIAKGGLMYEASVGGQKFSYKRLKNSY